MAIFNDVRAPFSHGVIVGGVFECNTAADPTTVSGAGYSVTHSATGVLDVTLSSTWGQVYSVITDRVYTGAATASDINVEVTDIAHEGNSFQVTTTSGGSATDFGSDVKVSFIAVARETSNKY